MDDDVNETTNNVNVTIAVIYDLDQEFEWVSIT